MTFCEGVVMIYRRAVLLLLGLLCVPGTNYAHHSVGATFDVSQIIEVEGSITAVRWRNPHVLFTVGVREDNGREELWQIQSNSVSILRRMDVSSDVLRVGERVRVAGNPGRQSGNQLYARNLLLPGAEEVLMSPGSEPRWAGETIGSSETWFADSGDGSDPASGIFRVWSTPLGPRRSGLGFWNASYPLTAESRTAVAAYDPVDDSPILNCAPKGMPTIMEQPYPMEFVEQDQAILLRLEEYDTIRTIHLDAEPERAEQPATHLGHSVGHWEDRTLVVATGDISWGYFNVVLGIPQSDAAELVERFTPSADGSRLDYAMTLTDPATFTEPVVLEKYWLWLPDVRVEPYECTVSE